MKSPSVSLLLGVCVLLLSALTVSAVLVYVPPHPPLRPVFQLVVFLPYAIATLLMMSIQSKLKAGPLLIVCMEMAQLDEETQEFREDYDDVAVAVREDYDDVAVAVREDYDDVAVAVTIEHDF